MASAKPNGLPSTEGVHPLGDLWSGASTEEALAIFSRADEEAVRAVAHGRRAIAAAIDAIAARMQDGGRLFYVGAGTSGRLGALDAAECPPTFQSAPEQVIAVLAGGSGAMQRAVEGAEDDREAGAQALTAYELQERDSVLGISASGGAPFVHGALEWAHERGAWTGLLACVARPQDTNHGWQWIAMPTGAELLAGSTRLKAGSATKMALNAISTLVMARLGKVYGHRMVDVATRGNRKLWQRGVRLVAELTHTENARAESLLQAADGSVKVAVLLHAGAASPEWARERLAQHAGRLDAALTTIQKES